jgi:hypothetical protein
MAQGVRSRQYDPPEWKLPMSGLTLPAVPKTNTVTMKTSSKMVLFVVAGSLLAMVPGLHAADAGSTPVTEHTHAARVMHGKVVSMDAAKGTLVLEHGTRHRTIMLNASTTFTSATGQSITTTDLKPGDMVAVHVSHLDGKSVATTVAVSPAGTKHKSS